MSRFAIIESGTVTNVVIWDGEAECADIPDTNVRLPDISPVCPGYTYANGVFTAPPPAPLPKL